jgi:K+ transporter
VGAIIRPLVLVYTAIAVVVTVVFSAEVDAHAGAYATGVLAMMSSAAFAVMLSAWRRGARLPAIMFWLITAVFVYALLANKVKRPDGIAISQLFIGAIVATSLLSRVYRSLELRQECTELDEAALRFVEEARYTSSLTSARRATRKNTITRGSSNAGTTTLLRTSP